MIQLRPYQQEACEAIKREWREGHRRTLLVLPTGAGKTICFANVAKDRVSAGDRVLILAHRSELLDQAEDKIRSATGLVCAKEKAESTSIGSFFRITVGSVQTMTREKRLTQFSENHFGTIIIDEAHHSLSDSYQRVLRHFPHAKVLGVTASPDRGDMRNLGEYFDSLAYEYTLPRAIREGYLCRIRAQTVPLSIDISKVGQSGGDYAAGALGTALDPYLDGIADEMVKYCQNRKTVVFLPLVSTSQKFCRILKDKGFKAAEVNGNSEERGQILSNFADGCYNVLCNSMLLTEGWDCPSVDCVVILRATKVRSLYCQMVGRGTRLSPETGKKDLLLLDFLWNTDRHELCRPAHLICKNDDVARKMTENLEASGAPEDIEEAEEKASEDIISQREEALAEELKAMKSRKRKLVDPLQFEMSIQSEDLAGYVPAFPWEMAPATKAQLTALEKYGIFPDEIECAGKANKILDRLAARRQNGLTTPKQIRFLESRGFQHVGNWLFDEANRMIGRISKNGWRTPQGVNPKTYQPESVNV